MRASINIVAIAISLLTVSMGLSQFRAPGGTPGGGAPTAPGGGMFKGPGGSGGASRDAGTMFDFLARGRPYFLISETRSMREPLAAFAKEKGITNDQITREQFTVFYGKMDQYRAPGAGAPPRSGFGPPGTAPGSSPNAATSAIPSAPGSPAGPGQNPLEAIGQWAEADLRRRDQNGDGKLTPDEMSETLRGQLDRWDTDRDGLISLDEYKVYYSARLQMRDGAPAATPVNPLTILIEDDYDRRPDVIRIGKLPKELPKWFGELDGDQDGQVALHEWFRAGKDIEEFKDWDRNDDGLVTAEEVLFKQRSANKTATASNDPPASTGGSSKRGPGDFGSRPESGGRSMEAGGRGSDTGGRPSGFGGFFKKKS